MFVDKLQVTPYDPATQYFEHMIFKTISFIVLNLLLFA